MWNIREKKERIKNFIETECIYRNKLDRVWFQHDLFYGDFKDLSKRSVSDKALHDKAFKIANNPKYDGYQRGVASVVCKFFDKKAGYTTHKEASIISND